MELFKLCIFTFFASIGLCFHYNIRGKHLYLACLGSTLTYFVYYMTGPLNSIVAQSFFASIVSSLYSETLARAVKVPATTFLIISIIPLVPGSYIYHSMELCIARQIMPFITSVLQTLGIAGAVALGILFVSSGFRFLTVIQRRLAYTKQKGRK